MNACLLKPSVAAALVIAAYVASPIAAAAQVRPDSSTTAAASSESTTASAPEVLHSMWDTVSFFAGLDGSKQPQDLGINANMGVRVSGNVGVPVSSRYGLGLQLGAALNVSDAAVHVLDQIEGTSSRRQTFVTIGLFQRVGQKANWALAYDHLAQEYYDSAQLGQVRGSVGYNVSPANEAGVWFAKSAKGANASMGGTPVRLEAISQASGYLTHTWPTAARTTFWAGVSDGHHNIVWVLPDNSRSERGFVYGAQLELPLSDRFGVSGSANFLSPTATGTVDAFLGLTYFPGRKAQAAARPAFAPRQEVANNPAFAVNMSR